MASKYRNVRTASIDGIVHASKMEALRWEELQLLQRSNQIRDLRRQVSYELASPVRLEPPYRGTHARQSPALRYLADFVYFDNVLGREVIEDCKGAVTEVYRIKRHLMKAVLGLDIFESKPRR